MLIEMKRLAVFLALVASAAFANDFDDRWYTTPGEWVVRGYLEPPWWYDICPSYVNKCASFMAQATSNKPLCVRYEDPFIRKDGRIIPSKVTEVGTFGEPGWSWTFETTELFTGLFEFHVKTIDMCPRVV